MKVYGFDVIGMSVTQDGPFRVTKMYVRGHVTHLYASFLYGLTGPESVFTKSELIPSHQLEVLDA